MIITIAGVPGSGKSTVKNGLAVKFGLRAFSIGDMRGKMARERGLTIDQLNEIGMEKDFTDREVDEFQKNLGDTEDGFVIDSWLGWHFIPHSVKIFLHCDLDEAARRIFADRQQNPERADEKAYESVEETKEIVRKRLEQTNARYKKWYNVDFLDRSHYDIVIDTSGNTPAQTMTAVRQALEKYGLAAR